MTNNTKQGLIVIAIFFGGVLVFGIVFGIPAMIERERQDRYEMLSAVKHLMDVSYQEVIAGKSNSVNRGAFPITTDDSRLAFSDEPERHHSFSGLVSLEDIWINQVPVQAQSTNLLCCVLFGEDFYAIDGTGNFRQISKGDFAQWPHVPGLETNVANPASH